jgi:hypothetical protein
MLEMALNLRENTRGFPDLLVWNDEDYAFIEIKSPTDHLSSRSCIGSISLPSMAYRAGSCG